MVDISDERYPNHLCPVYSLGLSFNIVPVPPAASQGHARRIFNKVPQGRLWERRQRMTLDDEKIKGLLVLRALSDHHPEAAAAPWTKAPMEHDGWRFYRTSFEL
ncbi:hypothetical protein CBL_01939 [Carabus blaptoides fortunei]